MLVPVHTKNLYMPKMPLGSLVERSQLAALVGPETLRELRVLFVGGVYGAEATFSFIGAHQGRPRPLRGGMFILSIKEKMIVQNRIHIV